MKVAVELDPFRAARPGVEEFVFDFDLARKNRELRGRGRFLQVNAIVDRDARLQLRHFHQGIAHVAAEAFQLGRALPRGPRGPGLQAVENEGQRRDEEERDQRESDRPGKFSPVQTGPDSSIAYPQKSTAPHVRWT